MSTKLEIQSNINSKINDGGSNTALEVRGVLNTDDDSLLNAVYPSEITETETTNTITINNSDFEYVVKITKIGRLVVLSGTYKCLISAPGLGVVFQIDLTNTEFKPSETPLSNPTDSFESTAIGSASIEGNFINCNLLQTGALILAGSILSGEKGFFSLTYNTFN